VAASDLPRLLFSCFEVLPSPRGVSRRVTEYLKGLSDRYQVIVLSLKTPDRSHIERYHGARLLRVPVGSGDLPSRIKAFDRAVRRQLDSEEYLVAHFFDPFCGFSISERKADLNYRVVYDVTSYPSVVAPLEYPAIQSDRRLLAKIRRQELFCLMNADAVIVPSALSEEYTHSLGVSKDKLHVVRSPVDLAAYVDEPATAPTSDVLRLVHVGHEDVVQGLDCVLDALKRALSQAAVRLTLVGLRSQEIRTSVQARVAAKDLAPHVEVLPPVPQDGLSKLLANYDVGLVSIDESDRYRRVGAPLSRIGEYLASGKPVVATDVAAARCLLSEGSGALFFRAGDAEGLSKVLVELASKPELRATLGKAAKEAALEWSSTKSREALTDLYTALTGTRRLADRAEAEASAESSDEATQLGRLSDGSDATQLGAHPTAPAEGTPTGATRVKTEPAVVAPPELLDAKPDGSERPTPTVTADAVPSPVRATSLPPGAPAATAPLFPAWKSPERSRGESSSPATPSPQATADLAPSEPALSPPSSAPFLPPATTVDLPPNQPARSPPSSAPFLPPATTVGMAPNQPARSPPSSAPFLAPATTVGMPSNQPARSPPSSVPLLPPATTVDLAPANPARSPPSSAPFLPPATTVGMPPNQPPASPPALPIAAPRPNTSVLQLSARAILSPLVASHATSSLPPPIVPPSLPPPSSSSPSSFALDEDIHELTDSDLTELPAPEPARPVAPSDPAHQALSKVAAGLEPALAADDEIPEVDGALPLDAQAISAPPTLLNPWLAQLVHGYCPPESHLFNRHTPPTTVPGRRTGL
jgi:glycosyltransferase involved in cell wall biosynthesis